MLRMLQTDLNDRTGDFQERLATANPADKARMEREAQELAAEQGRLAELVEKMLKRDNESKQEQPR
jgi:hypothetical protein